MREWSKEQKNCDKNWPQDVGSLIGPTLSFHKEGAFIVPLGENSFRFLRGDAKYFSYYKLTEVEIADHAIKRWVMPRLERRQEFLEFKREQYSPPNQPIGN